MHRLIEAMKHGFALRTQLGDPGPPGLDPAEQFLNLTAVLKDMVSDKFAEELRLINLIYNCIDVGTYVCTTPFDVCNFACVTDVAF